MQIDEFFSDTRTGSSRSYLELPISGRVFILVGAVSLLLSLIVFFRVAFLNVGRAAFYERRSEANVNREVPLPAHRGLITDRSGTLLVKNAETFSIFLSAAELIKNRPLLNEALLKISEVLSIPTEELYKTLEEGDFETKTSVALVRNIPTEEAISVRGLDLEGVLVENDFRREYILGSAFSHVLGYTGLEEEGSAIVGKTGLEASYDSELRGKDGAYIYYRDALGQVLDEGAASEPVAGKNLQTTLDAELQQYMYERLKQGLRDLGVKGAVGMAIDPNNSEVLAMASFPGYDNNVFVTPGMSAERTALINDKTKPLFNRAIMGAYNPGSTIKTLMALAALREGVISPERHIYSAGYIEVPNPYFPDQPSRFLDWRPQGYVNVRSALAKSSNVYFYEVGGGYSAPGEEAIVGLGIKRLKEYWKKFQFGTPTGIDIGGEHPGFLPDPEEKEKRTGDIWRLGDTYNVSIGQGDFLVSPIQLLNFTGSIANGGKIYQPHLRRQEGPAKLLFDYSSWTSELKEVRAGMEEAVSQDYGTAYKLSTLPIKVAAKTGSAQIQNNTKTNAFFVGYAPADNPQLAVLVLVEDALEGSLNAIPIAKDIFEWWYLNRSMK